MYVSADQQHLVVPWAENLARVVPQARELLHQGQRMLVLPNKPDIVRAARALGLRAPASILTGYDWLGKKPWAIQKTTASMLTENQRAYVLSQFGTGKTRAVIWAADYLQRHQGVGKVLVAAPLSTLTPVWEQELFRINPHARVKVLHGLKQDRLDRLDEDADFYIINHHGLPLMTDALLAKQFGIIVIDELAVLRNRQTKWWKAANALLREVPYAWGLTGSPTPREPTDAWAQMRLLTPAQTSQSFVRFRDLTMRQVSTFRWEKRPGASELIHKQMQPAVRFTLDDVGELPPLTYRTFKVDLEPEAKRAYSQMVKQMRVELQAKGDSITAVNEGVLQTKLLQVACGFVYTDTHKVHKVSATPRLDALRTIVEAVDRKYIVFVPYLHCLEGVARFLQQEGERISVVHGGTPLGQRNRTFSAFMNEDTPRGIVAHPACMAHGLTLTSANTVIWYSPVNNYETYEQANARVHRPGQTSKTTIAHLIGTPVEQAVYRRLQDRSNFQGLLLELFHADTGK